MKKIASLLSGICMSLNSFAQSPPDPPSLRLGLCGELVNYIPLTNVTIPVNFIFFQPLTGTGIFDTISKRHCDDIINFMNYKWGNLLPTNHPLPAPYTAPTGYTDSKIRFSFKSINFKPDTQYGVILPGGGEHQYPAYTVTDSNALNVVINMNPGYGPVGSGGVGSNKVTLLQTNAYGAFGVFDLGARHLYFLHEVGHALGLNHAHPDRQVPPPPANPTGTLLPPPPVNDFWYEDSITLYSQGNNYMGQVWANRDYLSPKQIGYIHYMLKMDPIVSKMVTNTACSPGADWAMPSGTYPGPIYADADLIIPQGNHVIFTGCVFMKNNAKIIVEPGGKLTLNGSHVTQFCNAPWQGIEVQSDPGVIQVIDPVTQMPNSSVGMLELINYSTIEGAQIGINVGKYNSTGTYFVAAGATFPGSYMQNTGAGIVTCENSTLVNNRIGVNFNPYFVYASNSPNKSYFKNSVIRADAISYNNPTGSPFASINLNTVFGIRILGCRFYDVDRITTHGIRCFNGSVIVKDDGSTQTSFRGFKYGIYLSNWLMNVPVAPTQLRHVKMDQLSVTNGVASLGGIYASGLFGLEVENCTLDIAQPPSTPGPLRYGLYLDGCDGYVVENNAFKGASGAYLTGGIFVNNSGPGANSIYNNTFQNLQQGLWTQNINYNSTSRAGQGLVMNCNQFLSGCKYNIGVQSSYMGPACVGVGCPPVPLQIGGIAKTQGVTTSGEDKNVRNTYSTPNCNDENQFYVNTQNSFSTIHGSFPGTQYHPVPPCSDPNEVIDRTGSSPVFPRTTWCHTNVFQNYNSAALAANISTNRANIASFTSELNSTLDGGNTSGLLEMIADGGVPHEDIYQALIDREYLSDEVLQAFFNISGFRRSLSAGSFYPERAG